MKCCGSICDSLGWHLINCAMSDTFKPSFTPILSNWGLWRLRAESWDGADEGVSFNTGAVSLREKKPSLLTTHHSPLTTQPFYSPLFPRHRTSSPLTFDLISQPCRSHLTIISSWVLVIVVTDVHRLEHLGRRRPLAAANSALGQAERAR